jgi:hypothetical protein
MRDVYFITRCARRLRHAESDPEALLRAGVHFIPATKAARLFCEPVGRAAYARATALKDGTDTGLVDITKYF